MASLGGGIVVRLRGECVFCFSFFFVGFLFLFLISYFYLFFFQKTCEIGFNGTSLHYQT